MHLLNLRWIRNTLALLAAGLVLAAGAPATRSAAQDEEPEPPAEEQAGAGQEQEDPAAEEQADGEQQGEAPQAQTGEDGESAEPRRLPPRTDEEERRYKLARAQNDPFLLDQISGEVRADPGEFYDPIESVLPVEVSDLSHYICLLYTSDAADE